MAFSPFMMSDVVAKIGGKEYAEQLSTVELAPSGGSPVTWKGLAKGSSFTFSQSSTWVCNLALAQDWADPESLSRYLFENEGESVDVEFRPNGGTGTPVYATIIVVPGSIGGAIDTVGTQTVSCGVLGKPSFTAPAAG